MIRRALVSLFLAVSAGASIVDRVPATDPQGTIASYSTTRVVASDMGMFLAGSHRITAEGVLVDDEPIAAVEGLAAAWRDGWMIVRPHGGRLYVRHLRSEGAPELLTVLPDATDNLQAVAGLNGRLAILEIDRWPQNELRLTVLDEQGQILGRRVLGGNATRATVSRFGDELVVAWLSIENAESVTLTAMRLDANGVPLQTRVIESLRGSPDNQLLLGASETHLIVLYGIHPAARHRVLDRNLVPSDPEILKAKTGSVRWGPPLAFDGRFLVSYSIQGEYFARVVRPDGRSNGDAPSDPIVGGDRIESRYLVVWPPARSAIAEDDPRTIVTSPVQLRSWVYEAWNQLRSTISGDVTLLRFGRYDSTETFLRVDQNGVAVDATPRPLPATLAKRVQVIAIPEGFAFAWFEDGIIRYQRLARSGDWIDESPIVLASGDASTRFAVHANDHDLLLAWATNEALFWRRLTHSGAPVDLAPRSVPHAVAPTYGYWGVSIWGNGRDRLIASTSVHICTITCEPAEPEPFIVEATTVDTHGNPLGLPVPTNAEGFAAIGLADGTWAIPSLDGPYRGDPVVLHLARNGNVLAREPVPVLSGRMLDAEPTGSGWRALLSWPNRLVEFEGPTTASRLTGIPTPRWPRFAAGSRLAFLDGSPDDETVAVPWTGRSSTVEGDLDVMMTDGGTTAGNYRRAVVSVRNKGQADVTAITVHGVGGSGQPFEIPLLRPGEVLRFATQVAAFTGAGPVLVVSDTITDLKPSDNTVTFADAAPPPRVRPVRR